MRIGADLSKSLSWCIGDEQTQALIDKAEDVGIFDRGQALGLTLDESLAVYAYSRKDLPGGQPPFRAVNTGLRFPLSEAATTMAAFATTFQSALRKLPAHLGIVIRRTDLPESHLDEAKRRRFSDAGFLSCSKRTDLIFGMDILIVRCTAAREIASLSAFPEESEVVYLPATRFRVVDLARELTGAILILEEV